MGVVVVDHRVDSVDVCLQLRPQPRRDVSGEGARDLLWGLGLRPPARVVVEIARSEELAQAAFGRSTKQLHLEHPVLGLRHAASIGDVVLGAVPRARYAEDVRDAVGRPDDHDTGPRRRREIAGTRVVEVVQPVRSELEVAITLLPVAEVGVLVVAVAAGLRLPERGGIHVAAVAGWRLVDRSGAVDHARRLRSELGRDLGRGHGAAEADRIRGGGSRERQRDNGDDQRHRPPRPPLHHRALIPPGIPRPRRHPGTGTMRRIIC